MPTQRAHACPHALSLPCCPQLVRVVAKSPKLSREYSVAVLSDSQPSELGALSHLISVHLACLAHVPNLRASTLAQLSMKQRVKFVCSARCTFIASQGVPNIAVLFVASRFRFLLAVFLLLVVPVISLVRTHV